MSSFISIQLNSLIEWNRILAFIYFPIFHIFLETFRNCADIAIISNTGGGVPPIFVDQSNPYLLYYRDSRAPEQNNIFPLIVR